VVVSVEVLDLYLRDIFQCLKPGGSFIWTTPCGNSGSIEHLYSLLTNNIGQSETGERRWKWEEPTHLRRMKTSELAIRLQAVGFEPPSYRLRSHLFSFLFTHTPLGRLPERYGVAMMKLDYKLFRALPNGASMIGCARKPQKP
ncbi:MAG: hypothetical protein SFY68_00690, partial [Candidatus Sumerlaeia bacterium]|nr:hypothetical protein [Candidatus Sumerlaeia bacterium]